MVAGIQESSSAVPAAATRFTGTFVIKFTITVKSAIPTSTPIVCTANASVFEQNPSTFAITNDIEESADIGATRGAGTASCTVTIPYSWLISFPATDTVTLSYILAAQGSTATSASRNSSQYIAVIPIPKSGTTTNETITATF
jgi:hypothetical protein